MQSKKCSPNIFRAFWIRDSRRVVCCGDIDPGDGFLTVRLDPLPTKRATTAIAELCEHLTATETRYPGTDLVLRYEVKNRP